MGFVSAFPLVSTLLSDLSGPLFLRREARKRMLGGCRKQVLEEDRNKKAVAG